MFWYTISSVELMTRGVEPAAFKAAYRNKSLVRIRVLDTVNPQILTLLRVLSETILTYTWIVVRTELFETKLRRRGADLVRTIFYGLVEQKGPELEAPEPLKRTRLSFFLC